MDSKSKKKIHRTKIFEMNYHFSIPLFAGYVAILNNFFDLALLNQEEYLWGAIPAATVSIFIWFLWASKYLNRNLGMRKWQFRPGRRTWPLKLPWPFVMGLLWPPRVIWNVLWIPYTFLPRLVVEAPILGTALRIAYLYCLNLVIAAFLPVPLLENLLFFYGVGLTKQNLIQWVLFVAPVYISDFLIWVNTEIHCKPEARKKVW